jgi:hypothetical protein
VPVSGVEGDANCRDTVPGSSGCEDDISELMPESTNAGGETEK